MMSHRPYYSQVALGGNCAALLKDGRPIGLLLLDERGRNRFIPASMLNSYDAACEAMPDDLPDFRPAIARFRLIQTRATQ